LVGPFLVRCVAPGSWVGAKNGVVGRQALQEAKPPSRCDEALFAEALASFNDLSDARSGRLYSSLLRKPPDL